MKKGKLLTWDITVVCPTEESYVETTTRDDGSAVELVTIQKSEKYLALQWTLFSLLLSKR